MMEKLERQKIKMYVSYENAESMILKESNKLNDSDFIDFSRKYFSITKTGSYNQLLGKLALMKELNKRFGEKYLTVFASLIDV